VRPAPPGYRYAAAPNPSAAAPFVARIREDLGADQVEIRNVYRGEKFVAGVVIARTRSHVTVADVAKKIAPGSTPPRPVKIAGKDAFVTVAGGGRGETSVIDTFSRFVLIVIAADRRTATDVAAPMLR
jgi:hypothetical protein